MTDTTSLVERLRGRGGVDGKVAGLLDEAAAELTRLQAENANLKTVMIAAAEEIHAHWQAHCDAEGYGPANLMHRLEAGIPSEYGYTAGRFAEMRAELGAARADIKRSRWLVQWLIDCGLLRAQRCAPTRDLPTGDYWILQRPAVIDGGSLEGYGKSEHEAIDAAIKETK